MCWCDDASPCTRVLLASGAIPLGFRASHPCSRELCTDLQAAQRLQLPSILERKEDFTLLAERLGAELTFGAEDNTSLFSQMGLPWVPHSAQAFTLFHFKQHWEKYVGIHERDLHIDCFKLKLNKEKGTNKQKGKCGNIFLRYAWNCCTS